jgi:hemoglobin-like flavoprotein
MRKRCCLPACSRHEVDPDVNTICLSVCSDVLTQEICVTSERRRLAQQAFATIQPFASELGMLFYSRLFELDPALRGLFKHDLANQAHSLMTMLQLAIEGLDAPEQFTHALHNLGVRHLDYGVQPEQYATMSAALLWTLEAALGPAFTPEVAAALTEVLSIITDQMQGKATDNA